MRRNELLEVCDLSEEDMRTHIRELEGKLFDLRFQMAIEGAQSSADYAQARKSLAQYKTMLRGRELAREREKPPVAEEVQENA